MMTIISFHIDTMSMIMMMIIIIMIMIIFIMKIIITCLSSKYH